MTDLSIQTFYPLGYPVEITSRSGEVFRDACRLWRTWPLLFQAEPVHIEVTAHTCPAPGAAPRFAPPARFVWNKNNFAEFDPASRSGAITISEKALNTLCFRHHFLEALVLTALDALFFTPLHAACVSRHGRGVLLCGDSGAGKSSLAYACARRGWTFVSDDAVHVAPGPDRIGVGGSGLIHLREPARALFHDVPEIAAGTMPNGKQAIEIDAAAHGLRTARSARIGPCVFLERRPGPPHWRDFSTPNAIRYFLKYLGRRETARARQHLGELLNSQPLLLEYEHVHDAVGEIESLVGAAA